MSIKITEFTAENVKRIKAVRVEPTANGLTIIGGKNGQGKTSVLDAIAWALGGDKYRPSEPRRDGSLTPPDLHIELSNGLVVERKGKNSDLKVIDPSGNKGGQQLLNSFVETLALDLPKFMEQSSKEKAKTLLQIIGVGDQLYALDAEEQKLYSRRHEIGQIAEQKKHAAQEMESYPDAPSEPVSVMELIKQQQDILARNGENERLRAKAKEISAEYSRLNEQFDELVIRRDKLRDDLAEANKSSEAYKYESTAELEANIAELDETNRKVRINQEKAIVQDEADNLAAQYEDLTGQIESVRTQKTDLLSGAKLPLEGLSVEDGELIYKGYAWDNMSGSDQLKVSTAIVRKLNPECGFVLLDKIEQMDTDSLAEFGEWLKKEDLQAIATRVSIGGECSIVIEDGYVKGTTPLDDIKEGSANADYKWED